MFQSELKSLPHEDICILVRPDNHPWNYICECGDASGLTVKEIRNTQAVFISHTHIDHFVNFDSLLRHQIGTERRIVICGPEGIAAQVQAKLKGYTWNLIAEGALTYEIREARSESEIQVFQVEPPHWELIPLPSRAGNTLFEDSAFTVTYTLLDHRIPTLAYKFQERETVKIDLGESGYRPGKWIQDLKVAYQAGNSEQLIQVGEESLPASALFYLLRRQPGDSLGIVMDHAAHAENHAKILAQFKGARKVYIECFYQNADWEFAELNFHSYAAMSGRIMAQAEVQEAVPAHFSRKYKEEDIRRVREEFEAALEQNKR